MIVAASLTDCPRSAAEAELTSVCVWPWRSEDMRTLLPSLLLLCLLRPRGAQRWRNSSGSLTRLTAAKLQPVSGRGQCDYCQISSTNTYCRYGASSGPGASCGTTLYGKVDPATRQEILDAHNDLRGKASWGW